MAGNPPEGLGDDFFEQILAVPPSYSGGGGGGESAGGGYAHGAAVGFCWVLGWWCWVQKMRSWDGAGYAVGFELGAGWVS
ncbi:hypothetical protein ACFXTH_000904 [Malus domestica]